MTGLRHRDASLATPCDGTDTPPDLKKSSQISWLCETYVMVGGAPLQQPNAKNQLSEIMHWYQHLICAMERPSNASPVLHKAT
jgi:hypothetical protein